MGHALAETGWTNKQASGPGRRAGGQAGRERLRQASRQAGRKPIRQASKQAGNQAGRQASRQASSGRQAVLFWVRL